MKGSIRAITGLIIILGAAGGLDNAADDQLLLATSVAVLGLLLMFSGVSAMKGQQ
jgi:hypothetical protein